MITRSQLELPQRRTYRVLNCLLVLWAAAVLLWYSFNIAMLYYHPSSWACGHEPCAYADPSTLVQGRDDLNIVYKVNRNRFCPTTMYRSIVTDEPIRDTKFSDAAPSIVTTLGEQIVRRKVDYARLLPVGCYVFITGLSADCREGKHSFYAPEVKFCVTENQDDK